MPKEGPERVPRIVDGVKVDEILYWVANLYGRHEAGRKFVTGHRQWFLERVWGRLPGKLSRYRKISLKTETY